MNYLRFGSSKKFIIFLHGWGADLNSFLWLKDYFIDDYSLIFLDFDGFGKSCVPDKPMSVSDYAEKLKLLLDGFDIDELVLVAHSFGGRVAIKFLFYHQNDYKNVRLCLVDSAGILPKRNLKYWLRVNKYKRLKRKAEFNADLKPKLENYGSSDYKILCPVMKQTFINVVNEDLSRLTKFLNVPTIIVWGTKDQETKPYMAKKLHKYIKNSKLIFIKNAGHFSFLEKKEEFVIILDTFLKNL